MSSPTLLTPYGYSSSTCGYCSAPGERSAGPSSKKYGVEAAQMSCQFYQNMVDRNWRRSGDFMYRPDMARSCCPQYTIRLSTANFKPGKKHRQVVNRWNRYLSTGAKPSASGEVEGAKGTRKGKRKAKEEDFFDSLKEYKVGYGKEGKHRFELELVAAELRQDTFELYKRYQIAVHKDRPDKVTELGFKRFLCDSPLGGAPIPYRLNAHKTRLPKAYGSYHLLYKVDNEIVGISVIDILPQCISSVYFIWDPEWAWGSLGKLSALWEIALARDISAAGSEGMKWLYMGFWIADCQKMRYKSEYSPSYLLDPGTLQFHPLTQKLDAYLRMHPRGYHPFENIDASTETPDGSSHTKSIQGVLPEYDESVELEEVEELGAFPSPPPPGFDHLASFTDENVAGLLVLTKGGFMRKSKRLVSMGELQFVEPSAVSKLVREMVSAVGMQHMAKSGGQIGELKDKGIISFV